MIEVTNSAGSIIAFDGRIIEVFINQESKRYHIRQLRSIEIKEKRNGSLEIMGQANATFFLITHFDASQKGLVDEFVAKVRSAMG